MTDVEQQLRDALARHAEDAPPPVQLLHVVRVQSRRRRQRHRIAVAGGLALVAAAGVTYYPTVAPDRGQQVAAATVELAPGPLSTVTFPYSPTGIEKPFVGLEAGQPILISGRTFLTVADREAGWKDGSLPLTPPFTFDLVPVGFTVDNVLPSAVTFAPPGTPAGAGFAGKIAVLLDAGSANGTEVTDEGTIFRKSVGDGRTLTIQVPRTVPLAGADLERFAAGIRTTAVAEAGQG